jgi:hypothetical protein
MEKLEGSEEPKKRRIVRGKGVCGYECIKKKKKKRKGTLSAKYGPFIAKVT